MPSTARSHRRDRTQKPKKPKLTARTADRHALYIEAVQAPELDARFYSRYFEKTTGQPLRLFREDFCGTAALSAAFVQRHSQNRAIGVDNHWPTLAWGRMHVLSKLTEEQRKRVQLVQADVREAKTPPVQAICAVNFSYSVFHTREELGRYIASCYRSLQPGGLLFLDAWGGGLVQRACVDKHRHRGFDYHWEQYRFDPISHAIECRIHFLFRDGTKLSSAFTYDWRLWTLPELRELYTEAGFEDVHVLWECTDSRTNTGNGVFRRKEKGDDDPAWITFVVGRKPGKPRKPGRLPRR